MEHVLSLRLEKNLDEKEFRKCIGFLSEAIRSFRIEDGILTVETDATEDSDTLRTKIETAEKKFLSSKHNRILFEHRAEKAYRSPAELTSICFMDEGMIALEQKSLFLFEYFDHRFREIALGLEAECVEKKYPVLLPREKYAMTGYLKNSPQYAMFCSSPHEDLTFLEGLEIKTKEGRLSELLNQPDYALSPSACFHTYIELQNQVLDSNRVVTFVQSVFRNEGRFNFGEFGRLRDYHVREIVLIGGEAFVCAKRLAVLERIKDLLSELDLSGDIAVACDPFILPKMQRYKKMQLSEESKYEVHLNYKKEEQVSVASLNLHGNAFTFPFHIGIKNIASPVTGCVGFGLERWVLAFLAQYGEEESRWPATVKERYQEWMN